MKNERAETAQLRKDNSERADMIAPVPKTNLDNTTARDHSRTVETGCARLPPGQGEGRGLEDDIHHARESAVRGAGGKGSDSATSDDAPSG